MVSFHKQNLNRRCIQNRFILFIGNLFTKLNFLICWVIFTFWIQTLFYIKLLILKGLIRTLATYLFSIKLTYFSNFLCSIFAAISFLYPTQLFVHILQAAFIISFVVTYMPKKHIQRIVLTYQLNEILYQFYLHSFVTIPVIIVSNHL